MSSIPSPSTGPNTKSKLLLMPQLLLRTVLGCEFDYPCCDTLGLKPRRSKSRPDFGSPLGTQAPRKGAAPEGLSLAPPKFSILSMLAPVSPAPSSPRLADLAESHQEDVLRLRLGEGDTAKKPILPSGVGLANL